MKKTVKRALSLCLTVVMLASLLSVCAFAASAAPHYENYVVIGDSIPSGYGLETNNAPDYKNLRVSHGELVTGSYAQIVASAVGAANTQVLSRCGFRTVEALRMLDKNYKYDLASDSMVSTLSQMNIDDHAFSNDPAKVVMSDTVTGLQAQTLSAVKAADLITINLGSNDTMTYALNRMEEFLSSKTTDPLLTIAEQQLKSFGTLGLALENMLAVAAKINQTSQALAVLSASLVHGYAAFKVNFALLVSKIEQLNPDAKIVVVGMYNPFENVKLSTASLVKIGAMADSVVELMNTYMAVVCPYASSYTYVDVMDTQAYTFDTILSGKFTNDFIRNVHPTAAGHQYIADQILTALSSAGSLSLNCADAAGKMAARAASRCILAK